MKDRATWGRKVAALVIAVVGAAGLSAQALASAAPLSAPAQVVVPATLIRPTTWSWMSTARARRCASDAFDLSLGSVGAARGHGYAVFNLLNVSRSSCEFEGFAGVGLRHPDGRRAWLHVHDATGRGWASPAVRRDMVHLSPGARADFWMEWAERAGHRDGSLSITAPGVARAIWLHNRLVPLDAGQVTVSPVTSAVLNS